RCRGELTLLSSRRRRSPLDLLIPTRSPRRRLPPSPLSPPRPSHAPPRARPGARAGEAYAVGCRPLHHLHVGRGPVARRKCS
ncbi:Os03g0386600, partial [Oryza sativa Japonica Group]